MKKKCKNFILIILCLAMTSCMLSGCSQTPETTSYDITETETQEVVIDPMEIEYVPTYSFDYIGGKDVMPITGYFGPCQTSYSYNGNNQPSNLRDEYFQMIAECGINLITYPQIDYKTAKSSVMKMLDLADKYHIGMCVFDSNVMYDYDITKDEAVSKMQNYLTHPACVGFFLYDEPGNSTFIPQRTHMSQLVNISEVLNKELGMFTYLNLSGAYVKDAEAFAGYVKEYCETQNQNYVSFDRYPSFSPNRKTKSQNDYIWNMALVRQYANEYDLPWWTYIGAGAQWNDEQKYFESTAYYPDEGEFDWNVNTALAFGTKGLSYFAMSQPYWFAYGKEEGVFDFERNSLIGAYGNKNRWYYYAQDINKHIAAIDEVLMNSVSKGVIAALDEETYARDMKDLTLDNYVDTSKLFIEGTSWRELSGVQGNAIIGCFNYYGKTALYVVNYEFDYAQKIDLSFVKECNIRVVQAAETSYVKTDRLILDMPAGDGVLLVFE